MSHARARLAIVALALAAQGCGSRLDSESVTEFMDEVDFSARELHGRSMCEKRARNFTWDLTFHPATRREGPPGYKEHSTWSRTQYCHYAIGTIGMPAYILERTGLSVTIAPDGQSAQVAATYREKQPHYDGAMTHPELFTEVRTNEFTDYHVIVIEDGELRIASTRTEGVFSIADRSEDPIPLRGDEE